MRGHAPWAIANRDRAAIDSRGRGEAGSIVEMVRVRGLLVAVALGACTGNPVESNGEAGGNGGGDSSSASTEPVTGGGMSSTGTSQGSTGGSSSSTTSDASAGPTGDPTSASAEGSSGDPGSSSMPIDTVTLTGLSETDAGSASDASTGSGGQDTGGCVDPYEPNDDADAAVDLGSVDCHDAPSTLDSVLDTNTGNDWYRYTGEWTCNDFEDGLATVTVVAGSPARVCLYPDCVATNSTYYACPMGDNLGDGICCTAAGGDTVQQYVNCPGSDESAYIWVYVELSDQSCEAYTLDYGYGPT